MQRRAPPLSKVFAKISIAKLSALGLIRDRLGKHVLCYLFVIEAKTKKMSKL